MNNRIAILTGAYGAIGKSIAEGLSGQGFQLVLVGRDEEQLKKVANSISKTTGNNNVSWQAVDLSRKQAIKSFAESWQGPLHLLINNAATTPPSREETPEGIEMQFATNVLGYFWMMQYFHPYMENQEDTRIVNVASYWAGDLNLNDPEFKSRSYNNDRAYRQSKQADRMLSSAFAKKLALKNITVLAAHPGDVSSKLSNNLGYGGWESPEQGADTPLFCATNPELKGSNGKYFEHRKETPCHFAADEKSVMELFELCEKY